MKWSLEYLDIYHFITKCLRAALIVRYAISQYILIPLSDRHWVVEARRLFETSLARIQLDAWGIGSGEDRVYEGKDWYHEEKGEVRIARVTVLLNLNHFEVVHTVIVN